MAKWGKGGVAQFKGNGIERAIAKFQANADPSDPPNNKGSLDFLVTGSNADDFLLGDDAANLILGFRGDDTILAGAGNDHVIAGRGDDRVEGGLGDDKLNGQSGFDTAVYAGSILDFQIFGLGHPHKAFISVLDTNASDGDEGRDRLFKFEALEFSDYTLDITGGNNAPLVVTEALTTDEDTAIAVAFEAYDFDADGLTLIDITWTGGGLLTEAAPPAPLLPLLGTGISFSYTFDPNGAYDTLAVGEYEVETVTVTVEDEHGLQTQVSFDITINGANDAPYLVVVPGADEEDSQVLIDTLGQTVNEADGVVQFDLNPVFDDIDSPTLTYSVITVTNLADGRGISIPATIVNGILTINPSDFGIAEGETLDVRVAVEADDGSGAANSSVVGTFDLHIIGSNDEAPPNPNSRPDAQDADITEGDQEPIVIDLNALVTDPDNGDVLTITDVTIPPVGRDGVAVEFSVENGVITINPGQFNLGEGEELSFSISYFVDDGSGQPNSSDNGTINLTVISGDDPAPPPPNTAPVATNGSTTVDATAQDIVIDLSTLASDPEGDDLTFDVSIRGGEQSINFSVFGNTIVIPWQQAQLLGLTEGANFGTVFDYTVSDGEFSASGSVNLTVNGPFDPGNSAPNAGSTTQDVNVEDGNFTVDLGALVSDADGDALTFTSVEIVIGANESGTPITVPQTFDPVTGIVTINPADFGLADGETLVANLNYTVDDGSGAANSSASGQVVLNVSDPPDVEPPAPSPTILDFEPIGQPGEYSVDMIALYDGFVFSGDLGVFSNDDQPLGDGGRDGFTPEPGIVNGVTSGDNVLVLRDGTLTVTGPIDSLDDRAPELFDLNTMNLTAASSDGVTVTITAFVLAFVPGIGQELVAQGSVDIVVNTSGPTVFDTSLLGDPTLFDDINAFEITTDSTDTLELVIDDMSLTYPTEDPLII